MPSTASANLRMRTNLAKSGTAARGRAIRAIFTSLRRTRLVRGSERSSRARLRVTVRERVVSLFRLSLRLAGTSGGAPHGTPPRDHAFVQTTGPGAAALCRSGTPIPSQLTGRMAAASDCCFVTQA